jgi:hypothetical protein
MQDPVPPIANKTAFFLTTGVASDVEGDLGEDGEGNARPNVDPCP